MSPEVESIVKEYGLENARIQVGRERIYPLREGLTVSPKAVEMLKSALSNPEAVQGTVKITAAEKTLYWVSKGVVNTPLDAQIKQEPAMQMQEAEKPATPVAETLKELPKSENDIARQTYLNLLTSHPEFKGSKDITHKELMGLTAKEQRLSDRQVMEMGALRERPREEMDRVLGQGSPYINTELITGSLPKARAYLVELSGDYKLYVQDEAIDNTPHAREFDYPKAAQTLDPAQSLKYAIALGTTTLQTTATSARENLELAQQNLAIFSKKVKHRGFKAWAADQMPILKEKVQTVAAEHSAKLKGWAKDQAPVVKAAAVKTAKQIGHQAAVKGKEIGAKAWEQIEKATQLVDPATLEPALRDMIAMFGENGRFAGAEVIYQKTKTGVDVHLKDGTPVYTNGKVNPNVDSRYAYRLSRIPQNVQQVKTEISQQYTVQDYQKKTIEHRGFGR